MLSPSIGAHESQDADASAANVVAPECKRLNNGRSDTSDANARLSVWVGARPDGNALLNSAVVTRRSGVLHPSCRIEQPFELLVFKVSDLAQPCGPLSLPQQDHHILWETHDFVGIDEIAGSNMFTAGLLSLAK